MIRQLLPLATSALTLAAMWLLGNKDRRGWIVGLANQGLWLAFIVMFEAWGLLPLCGALIVMYSRNLYRWSREALEPAPTVSVAVFDGAGSRLIHPAGVGCKFIGRQCSCGRMELGVVRTRRG